LTSPERLARIEILLEQGFKDMQIEIRKKASLDSPSYDPPISTAGFQKALYDALAKSAGGQPATVIVPNEDAFKAAFGFATEAEAEAVAKKFSQRWLIKESIEDLPSMAKHRAILKTDAGGTVRTQLQNGVIFLSDVDGNEARVTNTLPYENLKVIEVDRLLAPEGKSN
jgi:hypothetical protein